MILANRRITIREVADDVGISFGSCQAIITDVLNMKRATAKIVPKLLNFEQKQLCMAIAQEILMTFNDNPDLFKKFITGDESWNHGCMATTLKPKTNHPNGSIQKSKTEKRTSSSVRCKGFAYCFLRLQWRGAS